MYIWRWLNAWLWYQWSHIPEFEIHVPWAGGAWGGGGWLVINWPSGESYMSTYWTYITFYNIYVGSFTDFRDLLNTLLLFSQGDLHKMWNELFNSQGLRILIGGWQIEPFCKLFLGQLSLSGNLLPLVLIRLLSMLEI